MKTRRHILHFAFCISCAAGVAAALAQEPPRPTFHTEANYVRVDVYPTQNGAPVMDLSKDDFELLEDGTRQNVEQFERVAIRGNLPQEMRREPNTVAESRAAVQDARARVFVVFLDTGHVEVAGSHRIRQPLIDALNRLIGEDDLVALMTPEMSALDLAFARKTTTIEGLLTRYWPWGERDQLNVRDPVEANYETCFGPKETSAVTGELIARRREKQTLDALQDLVRYLRGAREERKAVLVVTDGWLLYTTNSALANTGGADRPPVVVNPGTGRLQVGDANMPNGVATTDCVRDLMYLARIDDARTYRDLLDEANYANTSFYPIDPRGLPVFDTPITAAIPLSVDVGLLRQRAQNLRQLAENTDGLAMVNSNDLAGSFKRIVNDLSSYYLLGYYSNGKLDGKFHAITVRVKRPGVQVRARRGYQAATPRSAAAAAASAAAAAVPAKVDAEASALAVAIAPLAGYTHEIPMRVHAAAGWKGGDPPTAGVWIAGELSGAREFDDMWRTGATAMIELAPADGASLASARVTLAPGTRTFLVSLTPAQPLHPGDYVVRVSARSADGALPTRDTLQITLPPSPHPGGVVWSRRGPSTGNRDTPTADLRFRRSERVVVETPTLSEDAPGARLLDRTGKALAVPVAATIRPDAQGVRWLNAQLALAPLAPGEYVIELAQGGERTLAAFKVIQ